MDEAVVRKLVAHAGGELGTVYGKQGKEFLRGKIQAYNNAARHGRWIVLVDLDHEADCAPRLREAWLSNIAPHLCFRIAVREVEAWLLADAETLAPSLRVRRNQVPADPEALRSPKTAMVQLANRSRRSSVRQDMMPRKGSGRAVGPAYTSTLTEYVRNCWRPDVAARNAESLRRSIACLEQLVASDT